MKGVEVTDGEAMCSPAGLMKRVSHVQPKEGSELKESTVRKWRGENLHRIDALSRSDCVSFSAARDAGIMTLSTVSQLVQL